MASSTTNTAIDPNHWVTNPPSIFVKIHSVTSRTELNHQYGLVVQYNSEKQRYMLVLCQQQKDVLSLKQDNLMPCTSMMDRGTAYIQMIRYNPQLQQQIQTIQTKLQTRVLQPLRITKIQYFYCLLLLLLLGSWYMIGFTKLLMVVSCWIVLLSLIGMDVLDGTVPIRTIVTVTLPQRYHDMMIATGQPYLGNTINTRPIYLRLLTMLLFGFITYSLLGTPTNSMFMRHYYPSTTTLQAQAENQRSSSNSLSILPFLPQWLYNQTKTSASPLQHLSKVQQHRPEYYYKLGYDDATHQLDFGTSLVPTKSDNEDVAGVAVTEDTAVTIETDGTQSTSIMEDGTTATTTKDPYRGSTSKAYRDTSRLDTDPRLYSDNSHYDDTRLYPKKSSSSSPFSFSTLMAIYTIYRIVQPIVMMSLRNDRTALDVPLLYTNLLQIDKWKGLVLLFSLYRLVAAFL
jgi:hypothetical protein